MSVCGWCVWFWQQEADATLRKARALKAQRREEYQKAQSSTNRSQEEQSNAGNKQLEKKRRLEEEALQKVGRGEDDRVKIVIVTYPDKAVNNSMYCVPVETLTPFLLSKFDFTAVLFSWMSAHSFYSAI